MAAANGFRFVRPMPWCLRAAWLTLLVGSGLGIGAAKAADVSPSSVYLEDMAWTELQGRIAAGSTTVLVPIGGTEQSGPHMVLGKHNARARFLAGQIAQRAGNTVVAPVLAYVPEGAIHPPEAHMRFTGTISIPDAAFEAVLEGAARSFKQHGFRHVVFLGDHGGYQQLEVRVAKRLNHEWANDPSCRVHALTEYYQVTQSRYIADLLKKGFSSAEIGTHAGLADTALALAVDPALVRTGELSAAAQAGKRGGVYGDPRRATAELGRIGVNLIVDSSVAALHALVQGQTSSSPLPITPKK
ncbi:MAG: creatininase family protein [Giesbergeria sp.]